MNRLPFFFAASAVLAILNFFAGAGFCSYGIGDAIYHCASKTIPGWMMFWTIGSAGAFALSLILIAYKETFK